MNIKKATLIALCGNAAVLLTYLLALFGCPIFFLYGQHTEPFVGLLGTGTLVFFLFTLYRKQP